MNKLLNKAKSWVEDQVSPQDPLVTRLIRNVRPELVNAVIAEFEENGFEIANILSREVMVKTGEFVTIYDIVVRGETDPTWGLYGY